MDAGMKLFCRSRIDFEPQEKLFMKVSFIQVDPINRHLRVNYETVVSFSRLMWNCFTIA